jgi:hypothetical protein
VSAIRSERAKGESDTSFGEVSAELLYPVQLPEQSTLGLIDDNRGLADDPLMSSTPGLYRRIHESLGIVCEAVIHAVHVSEPQRRHL